MAAATQNNPKTIPDIIRYSPPPVFRSTTKPSLVYGMLSRSVEVVRTFIGVQLRNAFFLPLFNKTPPPDLALDELVAIDELARCFPSPFAQPKTTASDSKPQKRVSFTAEHVQEPSLQKYEAIRRHFTMRDIKVAVEGPIVRVFMLRLFESKRPIAGKSLRVIIFSFNRNKEFDEKTPWIERDWNPLTLTALSEGPLSVLRALHQNRICVDSLKLFSLGNVALHGLKDVSLDRVEPGVVPQTVILDRGLASVKKTAHNTLSFFKKYFLHGLAKLCGWDADPETSFLDFLKKNQNNSGAKRNVVVIQARKDFYFSGKGALNSTFHEDVSKLAKIFQVAFWVFPFHHRSHHAAPLDHLQNNIATETIANTNDWFSLKKYENMADALARNIFFDEAKDCHTSLFVGGSEGTLNTEAARALPLLTGFINEATSREEPLANSSKAS